MYMGVNLVSSKGNQLKWFDGEYWYKADFLGYEALVEFLVSNLLKKTTATAFVDYELTQIKVENKIYTGCKSKHFLAENAELVTLARLFQSYNGVNLTDAYADMEVEDCIRYVVEGVEKITGLQKFGEYITMLLEVDALFLNEDRHMHNIAVVRRADGSFDYCPIFDNGAGLLSDTTISFGIDRSLEECYASVEAKPFNRSFDVQLDAAESMYGIQLRHWFTMNDVLGLLDTAREYYSEDIIGRVAELMRWQIRRYSYQEDFKLSLAFTQKY